MFCTNCGGQAAPEDRFCVGCGQALEGDEEENRRHSSLADSGRTAKKSLRKWLILSLTALILLLGGGYLFISGQTGNENPDSSPLMAAAADSDPGIQNQNNGQAEASEAPSEDEGSPAQSESQEATEEAAVQPLYIRVNQVDSEKYEQGKVDVYFSLFSDQEYEHEVNLEHMTKEMFKINQQPVQLVSQVENVDTVSVNLVIDKSGSMMDPPSSAVNTSKMDLVRQAAIEFLKQVPPAAKGQFELLTFSTYAPAAADISFTKDRSSLVDFLEGVGSDDGQTALYDTITKALYDTNMQAGPKYIIAFTDGEDSDYGSSAQSVIDLSRQLGIPVYTIGFGDMGTELKRISEETGGRHFALSIDDQLQDELQQIYESVFRSYTKQYKLSYTPQQKVIPGGEFSLAIDMTTPEQQARTEALTYTRKMDTNSIDVLSGMFEYQVNYAKAVNNLDFSYVQPNLKEGSAFHDNLKKRIEIDYVNAASQGKPKIIDPLENYRVESVAAQADGSYKIVFFKFFPVLLNNEEVYEADLNTYTFVRDPNSRQWQVSEFGRQECSIYRDSADPGSLCVDNGVKELYSGNPWPAN